MKFKTDEISVDAGFIAIFDKDYIISKGGKDPKNDCFEEFSGTSGCYNINYQIAESYLGQIKGSCKVKTKETIIISDPCYWFSHDHDAWLKFLEENEFGGINDEFIHFINTGGDGEFILEIEVTPCS